MVTHHIDGSFSRKGGNLFMVICGNLLLLPVQSNDMHSIILTWPGYMSLFGYWFSNLNHILVGL